MSGLDSIAFLDNWQVAKSAVGANRFRETSHSFYSDILLILCRNVKDLDNAIARDCKWLWAPSGPSRPGEMPRVPPTPFNDDAWHSARREAILKGASRSESQPLDAQCRFKLLFPPALSVEGVFQMAYILPERLLALVRPAFDLVLRRIRSLKRCVQA